MSSQNPHADAKERYKKALLKLAEKALVEVSALKPPVIQFCGPISTGGFGNAEENLSYLRSAIYATKEKGISVFNQVSYERQLDHILRDHHEYDYPLLDFFYNPILASGKISGLIFLPLWETSIGSKWENDIGKSLRIPIFYLQNMLVGEIESFYKSLG